MQMNSNMLQNVPLRCAIEPVCKWRLLDCTSKLCLSLTKPQYKLSFSECEPVDRISETLQIKNCIISIEKLPNRN